MRIEVKGMTLDEAINTAMIELSTTSDNIAYEVIQEASAGFLGIGSKPCIISAYKKNDKERIFSYNKNKSKKLKKLGIIPEENNNINTELEQSNMRPILINKNK